MTTKATIDDAIQAFTPLLDNVLTKIVGEGTGFFLAIFTSPENGEGELVSSGNTEIEITQQLIQAAFSYENKPDCDCVVGVAFELNPEEGPAWVQRYIPRSRAAKIPDDDWVTPFPHCINCGRQNPECEKLKQHLGA